MGANGKLRIVQEGYAAYCPGCSEYHTLDSRWQFNGNFSSPTFAPSLLIRNESGETCCHSYILDGKWQFLSDCTHRLKDQIVIMKDAD
jgi:hypothetical protein